MSRWLQLIKKNKSLKLIKNIQKAEKLCWSFCNMTSLGCKKKKNAKAKNPS